MTPLRKSQHEKLASIPHDIWRVNRTESIAHLTGIPWRIVHEFRRDNKLPRPSQLPRSGRPRLFDWSAYDPALTDEENAAVIGCTALTAKWYRLKKLKVKKRRRGRRARRNLEPEPFV